MAFKMNGVRPRSSKQLVLFLAAVLLLAGTLLASCGPHRETAVQDGDPNQQHADNHDSTSDVFVANAWGKEGLAGDVKDILLAHGFEDVDAGNAIMDSYPESMVLYATDDDLDRAQRISELLEIDSVQQLDEGTTWKENHAIVVLLGSDFDAKAGDSH